MTFVESLRAHRRAGMAMLAANFYNAETALGVVRAARRAGCEVIMQASPSTLRYLGVEVAAALARAAAREAGVTAWLHLDHATEVDLAQRCVGAGFDSVMIDASEKDLEANIAATQALALSAHAAGVAVEAELGYVPKLGQAEGRAADMTTPADARCFVAATGADMLAVAIGNAHGFYKREPHLDLARLEEIHAAVDVPLVLHGGSGLTPAQWRETIRRGVVKVNFATEIKDTFVATVKQSLDATDDIDLRKTFAPAVEAVTTLVEAKMRVCSMEDA